MIQSRDHFPQWLSEHGLIGTGVEVGTYYGEYAETLLQAWPGKLVGADPYENYPKEIWCDGCNLVNLKVAKQHAINRLERFRERFRLIAKPSVEAAQEFEKESLDFVYCDGNHSCAAVTADLFTWWPKIKHGGVLGGHDFYLRVDNEQNCEVPKAVINFYRQYNVPFSVTQDTSFWIIKP